MKSMKSKHMAIAAILVICGLLVQVGSTQEKTDDTKKTEKPQQTSVEQKLAGKLNKIEFKDTPLEEAIQYLRDVTGLNIFVNWKMLGNGAVDKSTPVNIYLENVTAASALKLVLKEVSEIASFGYDVEDNVITVSTREDLASRTVTRAYKIGDLIFVTRNNFNKLDGRPWTGSRLTAPTKHEQIDIDVTDETGQKYTEIIETTGLTMPKISEVKSSAPTNAIAGLIVKTIDHDSWRVNNGEVGSIRVLNDSLVVTNCWKAHKEIEKLLAELRESCNIATGVAVVRMNKADSEKKLNELVEKGGDIKAALLKGEKDGLWTLDRCELEKVAMGQVVLATDIHEHKIASDDTTMTTLTGYEIGVLPKASQDKGILFSVACAVAWYPKGHDPAKDTLEKNAGVTKRHNVYDFILPHGSAKAIPVIPADSKPGCVRLIIWLPEEAAEK